MHFPGEPGVGFAIFVEDAGGADQAGGVEDVFGPLGIDLEERAGLDIDAEVPGFFLIAVGVFVGGGEGEAVDEVFDCRIDGGGVGGGGEGVGGDVEEGLVAGDGEVVHVGLGLGGVVVFLGGGGFG